jgi:hypothetical protein
MFGVQEINLKSCQLERESFLTLIPQRPCPVHMKAKAPEANAAATLHTSPLHRIKSPLVLFHFHRRSSGNT